MIEIKHDQLEGLLKAQELYQLWIRDEELFLSFSAFLEAGIAQAKLEPPVLPDGSLAVPDGYCLMPVSLTAENGAKGLLSGEFHIEQSHICPECGNDDEPDPECDICEGNGGYYQKSPVEWGMIKDIYRMATLHLAVKQPGAGT